MPLRDMPRVPRTFHDQAPEGPFVETTLFGGAQGARVELVPTRDHLLLVAMAA